MITRFAPFISARNWHRFNRHAAVFFLVASFVTTAQAKPVYVQKATPLPGWGPITMGELEPDPRNESIPYYPDHRLRITETQVVDIDVENRGGRVLVSLDEVMTSDSRYLFVIYYLGSDSRDNRIGSIVVFSNDNGALTKLAVYDHGQKAVTRVQVNSKGHSLNCGERCIDSHDLIDITDVFVSSDDRQLVVASNAGKAVTYDLHEGKLYNPMVTEGMPDGVKCWNPLNDTLFVMSDNKFAAYDLGEMGSLFSLSTTGYVDIPFPSGFREFFSSCVFNPESDSVIASSPECLVNYKLDESQQFPVAVNSYYCNSQPWFGKISTTKQGNLLFRPVEGRNDVWVYNMDEAGALSNETRYQNDSFRSLVYGTFNDRKIEFDDHVLTQAEDSLTSADGEYLFTIGSICLSRFHIRRDKPLELTSFNCEKSFGYDASIILFPDQSHIVATSRSLSGSIKLQVYETPSLETIDTEKEELNPQQQQINKLRNKNKQLYILIQRVAKNSIDVNKLLRSIKPVDNEDTTVSTEVSPASDTEKENLEQQIQELIKKNTELYEFIQANAKDSREARKAAKHQHEAE